jgi:putative FmdB family regulatory protein
VPVYDYECPKCGYFEARRGVEESFTPCSVCGTPAKREAVYAYQSTITESGGNSYPSKNAKDHRGRVRVSDFQEASAEIDHAYSQAEKREGQPIKSPNLYKAGIRRARKMREK